MSVSAELATIQRAVEGVLSLLDVEHLVAGLDAEAGRRVAAVLVLVWCRLRDLDRGVRGIVDPALLWAEHNAALEPQPGDEPDVLLKPMKR
ncbi:MAG: hypothetical protein HY901_08015 [Deltaproteobacteria bacterium]|nr:hypothetical protein [Deltaproteobacteria bacterium]